MQSWGWRKPSKTIYENNVFNKFNINKTLSKLKADGGKRAKSAPLQHNDPEAKKKHGNQYRKPENQKLHEDWHKKHTPGFIESGKGERDFSKRISELGSVIFSNYHC